VREDAFRFSWSRTAELFIANITSACGYAAAGRSQSAIWHAARARMPLAAKAT
jgi:hypothetical protein